MKTAAPDFKIFWDEAYIVHHLTDEIIETKLDEYKEHKFSDDDRKHLRETGNLGRVVDLSLIHI